MLGDEDALGWSGLSTIVFLDNDRDHKKAFSHGISFLFLKMSYPLLVWDFPGGSDGKASVYNAGDPGSIPELGRSPGEGNGNPLQYYCLQNPMDRGAW